jgi:hypothetical protein
MKVLALLLLFLVACGGEAPRRSDDTAETHGKSFSRSSVQFTPDTGWVYTDSVPSAWRATDSAVIGWTYTDSVPRTYAYTDSLGLYTYTDSLPSRWVYTESAYVAPPPPPPPIDTTPIPPPPPVAGVPAGFRLLSTRPFNAKAELNWVAYAVNNLQIVPESNGTIGRAMFYPNLRPGTGPINTYLSFSTPSLFVSFQVRLSANFMGACTSKVSKIFHIWQGTTPTSVVVPAFYHCGMGSTLLQMRMQNTASGSFNLNGNVLGGVRSVVRDRWYTVAVLMQPGRVQWWVDGVFSGDHPVTFKPGPFTRVSFNPTWGGIQCVSGTNVSATGGPCDKITVAQWMDMDEVLVAFGP